jgi:LuxR family transcriptional regulator, maltose regulon positive regulatory protein
MPVPILAAKLYITAPRPGIVLRQRLTNRLNKDLTKGGKLTLVSAPAGFGKTTLISAWIAQCGRPTAWLSLDEGDNDLARFLTYLIAALQTIQAGIGESQLTALQSHQPPQTETILTTLLNDIGSITRDFVLVLDDYHVLSSKPIDEALAVVVERLPPQMHLVISTREDPHLHLARLRARGQLTELRATDLRFTPAETAEFLNRIMGLNLSAKDISALESRTEGWIAGLQLAAISMQGLPDTASFIRSFTGSHRFVLDYLIEEVLQRQPENIQTFLLRTSILDRMCGPLCDAVLDAPSGFGQETLEYLERANLFVVPLDQERRWYRYHHLFGDLLRQRLGQPKELPDYHLRASAWYEANKNLAEAFQHSLAADDFEQAARLAEAAWQSMERNFQTLAWLGWVKKLPNSTVCSSPWLCVQMGWAYSDIGEVDPSETYLRHAERAMAGVNDQEAFQLIPRNIALIRAGNAQIEGHLSETVRYAELAVQLIPENELLIRSQAAITLGFTQWTVGNVEASLRAMHTWMDDMQRLGNQMYAIASAFVVSDMQITLGRLGAAEKALWHAIQQATALGQEAEVVTAHHHLGLAMLAHERGDDAMSAERLQTVVERGSHTTLIDWPYRWGLAQARLKESAGEWDDALKSLDEAKRGYVKNPIPMLQPIEARKARIHLKQGRLDKAQDWVRERGLSVTDEVSYLGEYQYLTLARIRLAECSFEGLDKLVERLLALAETQKRTGSVIEILLTQALVYQAQGDQLRAFAALERALTLSEPEGYLRTFIDEGEPMQLMILDFRLQIEKQERPGTYPLFQYVNGLLAAFPKSTGTHTQSKIANQKSKIVEPLSERELEVLKLLRSDLSGPEIAERLIVSLNTLRTHTKNIFNKLGVNNRRAAIRRADELNLF